ncbi:MAG: ABC transporter permease subunit [Alphaproteobacteria bacterium]|jgi:putrescine transport system permease protein|nr:ABC transporter permease subunit [Alphaproteobacteria bacterium]MBP7729785.1 ABC transporter permease subunit [Alphaproteobacteria bacterium]
MQHKLSPFLKTSMILGYVFLYLPIITLIIFSFNASRQVTIWHGFSTKWYASLLQDDVLINSAWVSLQIAISAATLAVVLGTIAAVVLVRLGRFRGRSFFGILTTAPLVMPEVITGLALLLLFIGLEQAIGWPKGRGILTITIAHITLCMAYVTILVKGRLADMDRSLEEAALDLGARPLKVFMAITLPLIFPALLAGWLLAFALSLDDLVIASFVSGPGSSTLPMVIFSSIRFGISPQINALATIIITSVAISVMIAGWLLHRRR